MKKIFEKNKIIYCRITLIWMDALLRNKMYFIFDQFIRQ